MHIKSPSPYPGNACKPLIFIASKTLYFPSPTCGRGSPAGAGEGALAGKSTLSLTLSHQWEREQTQVCSDLFPGQKSVACRATGVSPTSGRGNNYCVVRSVFPGQKSVARRDAGVSQTQEGVFCAYMRHLELG
jgi:hypothetical protein